MSRITKMLAAVVVAGFLAIVPAVTAQAATGGCADTNSTYPPTPALTPLPNATPDECLQPKDYSQAVKPPVGVDPAPNDQSNPLVGENNTGSFKNPFGDGSDIILDGDVIVSQQDLNDLELHAKIGMWTTIVLLVMFIITAWLCIMATRRANRAERELEASKKPSYILH